MASNQKEQCYGIIPLHFGEKGAKAFLIQHVNGKHWGFPKGHPEEGESFKQTAERELFEETGLQIEHYLSNEPLIETYFYLTQGKELIFKEVTYFLAKVSTSLELNREEVIQGEWFLLKNLLNTVTFPCQKKLYEKLIAIFL